MKKETYKGLGVILLSMAGYFVIYNLLMFEFMEQSKTLKDAIVDAFTVSGITIIHVRLLLIVIISLAASVIWLIDFVVYKSFCHIAGAGHISTIKNIADNAYKPFAGAFGYLLHSFFPYLSDEWNGN